MWNGVLATNSPSPADPPRNIILTGFMGTGKSTTGKIVAKRLGWIFVDTDALIVQRAGHPIPVIFREHGEAAFRAMEGEVGRELAAGQAQVIATGGGMLIDTALRDDMANGNLLICLTASERVIGLRLGSGKGRPLAREWRALLAKRRAAYAAMPNHIDTTDKRPAKVAEEVIALWQTLSK